FTYGIGGPTEWTKRAREWRGVGAPPPPRDTQGARVPPAGAHDPLLQKKPAPHGRGGRPDIPPGVVRRRGAPAITGQAAISRHTRGWSSSPVLTTGNEHNSHCHGECQ